MYLCMNAYFHTPTLPVMLPFLHLLIILILDFAVLNTVLINLKVSSLINIHISKIRLYSGYFIQVHAIV